MAATSGVICCEAAERRGAIFEGSRANSAIAGIEAPTARSCSTGIDEGPLALSARRGLASCAGSTVDGEAAEPAATSCGDGASLGSTTANARRVGVRWAVCVSRGVCSEVLGRVAEEVAAWGVVGMGSGWASCPTELGASARRRLLGRSGARGSSAGRVGWATCRGCSLGVGDWGISTADEVRRIGFGVLGLSGIGSRGGAIRAISVRSGCRREAGNSSTARCWLMRTSAVSRCCGATSVLGGASARRGWVRSSGSGML